MCEDRIKSIRDDISLWIGRCGAAGLKLPQGLDLSNYRLRIETQLKTARVASTDDKIFVDDVQKSCKNFFDLLDQAQIVCNSKKFMETSDSDQYVLVHHEYAGLAGIELNGSDGSDYSISNQISGYLQNQEVKKLAIKDL